MRRLRTRAPMEAMKAMCGLHGPLDQMRDLLPRAAAHGQGRDRRQPDLVVQLNEHVVGGAAAAAVAWRRAMLVPDADDVAEFDAARGGARLGERAQVAVLAR